MEETLSSQSPIKQPSAWLPVVMSLTALIVVLGHLIMFGATREADEGVAAHVWQLLMVLQAPWVAWFALTWPRRAQRQSILILTLQAIAAFTAVVPVWFFRL